MICPRCSDEMLDELVPHYEVPISLPLVVCRDCALNWIQEFKSEHSRLEVLDMKTAFRLKHGIELNLLEEGLKEFLELEFQVINRTIRWLEE